MMLLLESISASWFKWIYAACWQLAVLVLVIAFLSWICGVFRIPDASRVRHALWLIVLIKVFLPPSLAAPIGIGDWAITPISRASTVAELVVNGEASGLPLTASAENDPKSNATAKHFSASALMMITWAIGALTFLCCVGYRHRSLKRAIGKQPIVDEGPLAISLEKAAMKLGIAASPELRITDALTSPFLFGVLHPCVVLPKHFVDQAPEPELDAVLTHELVHMQRRDTLIGWFQVIAQGLFWFHPMVWWANRELRHQREEVCDDMVLREGGISPDTYGESMMRVLTAAKAKSFAEGSLVGVFERGTNLQARLEKIMSHDSNRSRFGLMSKIAILALATVLLPMAPSGQSRLEAQEAPGKKKQSSANGVAKSDSSPPSIVKTFPKVGATGVRASIKSIRVVFDRDMAAGMSWTGGPPDFPASDKTQKAKWIDKRTCVLPVKLERGKFYRVGINSKSFQNFRSADGVPTRPSAIYFATEGASKQVMARAQKPEIEKLVPPNGATDVDPSLSEIKVTFNMPMGGGMSWTGGGENFPTISKRGKPKWSDDKRTCTLPVKLKANHQYNMGLNSPSHNNFQSEGGVPITPVRYSFKTK